MEKDTFYIDYTQIKQGIKNFISKDYNYEFNLNTGYFKRWGKTFDDDPSYSPFGPEILDFEISTICDGVTSIAEDKEGKCNPTRKLCSYCYKENTNVGINISFEKFKDVINKINRNGQLTQVAFGLGASGEENPDLWKMCEWLRSQGIIPNGTVADITDETADKIAKYFGACAISCHGDKNVCYNMVKKLTNSVLDSYVYVKELQD